MIARVAVPPLEAHGVPRSEHEGAALLDRIALRTPWRKPLAKARTPLTTASG